MMRYEILWIDDSPDWVAPMQESISEYLDERGLELVVALFPDWHGATAHLELNDPDLIAVDYNLKDLKGDVVVEHIREKERYTEILFYTAAEDYMELLKPQDGVYRASRVSAEEKIRNLIDLTLKRVQSPANMRGLVIAETIDIETLIEDILVSYFEEKGEFFRERVLRKDGVYDFGKKYQFLLGLIRDRIKDCNVALNSGGPKDPVTQDLFDNLSLLKTTLGQFDSEVIRTRNILAHVQEQKDDKGHVTLKSTLTKSGGSITIDNEWCVKIRKDLVKHRQALVDILALGVG